MNHQARIQAAVAGIVALGLASLVAAQPVKLTRARVFTDAKEKHARLRVGVELDQDRGLRRLGVRTRHGGGHPGSIVPGAAVTSRRGARPCPSSR